MNDFLIIIPALNEEENIGRVIAGIIKLNFNADIVVISDGSTDKTADIAIDMGIHVISHPYNLGYGAAIQTGFKYAVVRGYKYVIQFDADDQHNPIDIGKIICEFGAGQADIVIGSRFLGAPTMKTGFLKMTAITLFRALIKCSTGTVITDPTSGLKGLARPVFTYFSRMGKYPNDYPDADILIQMIRNKYKVTEFYANMRSRDAGKSMHSGLKPIFYLIKMLLSITIILLRDKFVKED